MSEREVLHKIDCGDVTCDNESGDYCEGLNTSSGVLSSNFWCEVFEETIIARKRCKACLRDEAAAKGLREELRDYKLIAEDKDAESDEVAQERDEVNLENLQLHAENARLKAQVEELEPYKTDYLGLRSMCGLNDSEDDCVANFIDRQWGKVEEAQSENASLKSTIKRLNRRCTTYEAGLSERAERTERGQKLINAGLEMAKAEVDGLKDTAIKLGQLLEIRRNEVETLKSLALEWVPVGERLPGEGKRVLVLIHGKYIRILTLGLYSKWEDAQGNQILGITHWAEMPALPGGDDE